MCIVAPCSRPEYQYSELNQNEVLSEDEDDQRYDPRPRGLRRYRDIPDEVSTWL